MEKNENEELLEQSPADIQQEDTQEIAKSGEEEPDTEEQKVSNGRFILWSLAGVYLLYTSYSLCKGYVTGEEGTSMGFMLAGIAFAAIGAGLLFFGIKNMLSEEKIRKAKAAKNAAMEAAAERAERCRGGQNGAACAGAGRPAQGVERGIFRRYGPLPVLFAGGA